MRGGARKGAGRKGILSPGVRHRTREIVSRRTPLHVTLKYMAYIRNKETLRLLKRAIVNARKQGLRILHFSFQRNHIHLILEADTNLVLTAGMRSLAITFAKGLGRGKIQLRRYHLHVLKTLREARNAINYVLFNEQKHDSGTCSTVSGFSSVLSMRDGLERVKNFARKKRRLLKIGFREWWEADKNRSWLAGRALSE